jgi:hypothetical protein
MTPRNRTGSRAPRSLASQADSHAEAVPDLTGRLAEFRTALLEEIQAARRAASSSAVSLADGRRISAVGASYQYAFRIEDNLNAPADSPGQLFVAGSHFDCTVVSVEGMTVVIGVETDLGSFVPTASLQSSLADLMKKLVDRIETSSTAPNRVGDRILEPRLSSSTAKRVEQSENELNANQLSAVSCALGKDLTFIWGPPGTGKTRTIGAIGFELLQRDRAVLLVSHTNTAVDQALLRVAELVQRVHPKELTEGKVIRVGEPRDPRLSKQPDLLLKTHVARRSEELTAKLTILTAEQKSTAEALKECIWLLELCEWATSAAEEMRQVGRVVGSLAQREAALSMDLEQNERIQAGRVCFEMLVDAAEAAIGRQHEVAMLRDVVSEEVKGGQRDQAARRQAQRHLTAMLSYLDDQSIPRPIASLKVQPIAADALSLYEVDRGFGAMSEERDRGVSELHRAQDLYERSAAAGRISRLWSRLPDPAEQLEVVERVRRDVRQLEERLGIACRRVEALAENLATETAGRAEKLDGLRKDVAGIEAELARFLSEYGSEPRTVLADAHAALDEAIESQQRVTRAKRELVSERRTTEEMLREKYRSLQEAGLLAESDDPRRLPAEEMVAALQEAHETARKQTIGRDLVGLGRQRDGVDAKLHVLTSQITDIEGALKQVETLVIAEATVVGTTLTRAYLRDDIQARRFDTVILDEASMAPIPALWCAAGLADSNAVVVGDFKQLPPIVLSDHDLAQKWLGRDIFEVAGMADSRPTPSQRTDLTTQHRMHPEISRIPNELVYDERLRDDAECSNDASLEGWYERDWGHDCPVLLVDTAETHAWVTSVSRGGRPSRLNFLSATMCVDLADQLLRENRPPLEAGARPRILLISPYRPHARLMEILVREHHLEGDVAAGTAHMFQGSEADVVILDLVNDEPHWRVGMFNPGNDDSTQRLINVALTRAKRRLIVLGDFAYIQRCSRRAFLGKTFLPYLIDHYPMVRAQDVVPCGLAARAAEARRLAVGGTVESPEERLIGRQDHYHLLVGDMDRAESRIVIYSPYVAQQRLGQLEAHLRAAVERGVAVWVITKPLDERAATEKASYRYLEQTLRQWGAGIIHKCRMHEKLVFVDDGILWSGSLNPLSHRDTQEYWERRCSKGVVHECATAIRMEELVGTSASGNLRCPVCHEELVAREGVDTPVFYSCPSCHYSRNVEVPPPVDGLIRCPTCGGELEFGSWGEKPAWRCLENRHHHLRFDRSHILLPLMREKVPDEEIRRVGTTTGSRPRRGGSAEQESLFGDRS